MASADILRAAHEDLPWEVSKAACNIILSFRDGKQHSFVAKCYGFSGVDEHGEANAAFIVRACNAHYQMLEALKVLRQHLALFCGPEDAVAKASFDKADAAIAAAEAEAGR